MSTLGTLPNCLDGALSFGRSARFSHHHPHILGSGKVPYPSIQTVGFREGHLLLPNGDSYSGTLLGNIPEGCGKYIWSDGCIYEGDWKRGMRQGIGKLSWSSGAVYVGEFLDGYVHGTGTYIGPNEMTHEGQWRLNLKHGFGCQTYPNGDTFEGHWSQGVIEGPGKYTWANGNVYIGNMKGGKMSGKGTLSWTNGDSFEGTWLDGMMHGFGAYKWKEGGCYVGLWTRGLKDGTGRFYPKGGKLLAALKLYLKALRKRGLLPDENLSFRFHIHHAYSVDTGNLTDGEIHGSNGESSDMPSKGHPLNLEQSRNKNMPLEKRWSPQKFIEEIFGNVLFASKKLAIEGDEKEAKANSSILEREYVQGFLISERLVANSFSSLPGGASKRKNSKNIKKPGEKIIKGHRSYDLMISLQHGIRYTVGNINPIQSREVRASDFGPRASFWMSFPKEGSRLTPPHRAQDFKWKDYCPMVFRNLREMFKIDIADYMISICGNEALRELPSPGKSGSIFFLSQDDRFMIKTLKRSEVQVLLSMLPNYYQHVRTYENTLITKIFGLHGIRPSSGQKFQFVVMGNMFCTQLRIHRRFDLKGSSIGRLADNVEIDENTTLKDLDLKYCFYLEPSWRVALLRQVEIDIKFLESQHIMDYSLLLGVHYRALQHVQSFVSHHQSGTEEAEEDTLFYYPQGIVLVPRGSGKNNGIAGPHIRGSPLRASSAGDKEVNLLLPGTARLQIQLGVNLPARAEHIPTEDKTHLFHRVNDVVLYMGIIDILQEYNMRKKIENRYKSFQFDSFSISAVDPSLYSQRFLQFIQKVFPETPQHATAPHEQKNNG